MLLLLTSLMACTDYGFGAEPVQGKEAADDTDVVVDGSGDTDPTNDTDSGEGTVGDDTDGGDDTDPNGDTGGGDTGDTDPPDIPTDDDCEIAVNLDGWLDQFQVPGDDHVYFCHSGSGNYTMVDSNVDSCIKHLNHDWDVFPTTLCDT